VDEELVGELGVKIVKAPTTESNKFLVRHDSDKLAREILRVFHEKAPTRLYDV